MECIYEFIDTWGMKEKGSNHMRLRNVTGSDEMIAASPFVVQEPKTHKGSWQQVFGNEHPIRIEVGMGKGKFIMQLAKENPEINYIGIEKYSTVLLRALQKMELEPLPNVVFLCIDAKELTEVFDKEEIDRIYLNFSDPWPKDRHAKRRLPSHQFLEKFDQILKKDGRLEFKTDNLGLFQFAVDELPIANWKAEVITYDLHHDAELCQGNIMTEYEEKFSSQGNPICKYVIYRER